ncbi:MAG: class I SAM-dependent RNA methyltransferase [Bacteroidetes bacterium]|nr:class I SAM-dependent RNA methyltransferase [Bacteroidota bacterium]
MQEQYIAKTLQGFEPILAKELMDLGARDVEILKRAVAFSGDKAMLYAANIHLRTAIKILKPITSFTANDEHELYDKVMAIDWSEIMNVDDTFAIDNTIFSTVFTHSNYPALKMKDAIVDQFRNKYDKRPSIEKINPTYRFNLRVKENQVSISLDSSGESLHKRGYRTEQHAAPMSEVQAAGLILLSGWNYNIPLYDPMCGSGTILIEAALIANNIAPGLIRKHFGFQLWKDYDVTLFRQLMVQAASEVKNNKLMIRGSDISQRNLDMAQIHIDNAVPDAGIQLFPASFEDTEAQNHKGMLIMNPPYGERMQQERIVEFYQMIGNTLKRKYAGCIAWVFSGNLDAAKFIGLKPSEKIKLKNGPIDCVFLKFEIREGKFGQK